MTALALVLLFSGLEFVPQEMSGLHVDVDPFTGTVTANFVQTDLDGNGAKDIVLPDCVRFQTAGSFEPTRTIAIPSAEEGPSLDIWGQQIFLRFEKSLRAIRWDGTTWKTDIDQPIEWPTLAHSALPEHRVRKPAARIDRFLHDLDNDRIPEIVLPVESGLYVLQRAGDRYAPACVLDVFPPLRLSRTEGQRLWPPKDRRVLFPARRMSCRFILEGSNAIILSQEPIPANLLQYEVTRFAIEKPPNGLFNVSRQSGTSDEAIPSFLHPCRLNADDSIDYCGGEWDWSSADLIPSPVYQTVASTDGGRTLQTVRTASFSPHVCVVDFDGDGDMDLVTENTGLLEGGVRESANRLVSSSRVHHEIRIHFQNSEGHFSTTPDVTGKFTVQLDAPPITGSRFFWRYQSGELFDITGDFNADGKKDLLIHQRPDAMCLYLSEETGFSEKPAATLHSSPDRQFAVYDVDGDECSDIILKWNQADSRQPSSGAVFLTRKGAS